jgi:hypothetical protein
MGDYIPPGFTQLPGNNVWPAEEREEVALKLIQTHLML